MPKAGEPYYWYVLDKLRKLTFGNAAASCALLPPTNILRIQSQIANAKILR